MVIYLDWGSACPPLKLKFADSQYIGGYRNLFARTGQIDTDNGLDYMKADYKSGYCIFRFYTSLSLCHGKPQKKENKWNFACQYRV